MSSRTSTLGDTASESLYAKRRKIQVRDITGRFRRLKTQVLVLLLAIYYIVPWLRWDRGPNAPDQAVLVDFPSRKFYFFFIEIWPQEVYYLTGILIMMAIGLFGITATVGRVWCGFACPQTVWTDLYMAVERFFEGDRNARLRLDQAPFSLNKAWRRTAKHIAWLLIAVATGGAWVFYFADAPTLAADLVHFQASSTAYITIGILTLTTYSFAGLAREQICTYCCPYSRFQAAMLDEHSVVVTYRTDRGEPRGKGKAAARAALAPVSGAGEVAAPAPKLGDCIDCAACVTVCPTGIDIRNGQQLECINCGLCIDACNHVMDKIGRPRGLIALDTLANLEQRTAGIDPAPKIRIWRPRVFVYMALWAGVGLIMLVTLLTRANLDLTVQRDRNPLFVTLSDGSIRNGYTFHLINKKHVDRQVVLSIEGLPGARLMVLNTGEAPAPVLTLGPDAVTAERIFVTVPRGAIAADSTDFRFVLRDPVSGDEAHYGGIFRGPGK